MIKKFKDIFDKYELLEEIEDAFLYFTDKLKKTSSTYISEMEEGEYMLYLNDTNDNEYADDNYYFSVDLSRNNSLPKGYSDDINFLKSTPFYQELKDCLNRLKHTNHIKYILFYYENDMDEEICPTIEIKIIVNDNNEYSKIINYEKKLKKLGFQIGNNYIAMELKSIIIKVDKDDDDHTQQVKTISIYDKNWKFIDFLSIDERQYNTIESDSRKDIIKKIITAHMLMKKSDPKYGTYIAAKGIGKEGKEPLYARDFIVWLKNKGY